jgi:hypothetical protein
MFKNYIHQEQLVSICCLNLFIFVTISIEPFQEINSKHALRRPTVFINLSQMKNNTSRTCKQSITTWCQTSFQTWPVHAGKLIIFLYYRGYISCIPSQEIPRLTLKHYFFSQFGAINTIHEGLLGFMANQ